MICAQMSRHFNANSPYFWTAVWDKTEDCASVALSTHGDIYIYIYIAIHWQTVSLYHNFSVWLDPRDTSS